MANFVRSNLIVASGTACSRATGLLRVIVLAYVVGQNALSDAYKLSNETPNIVYDLVIGGVLSATLVPVFTSLIVQERRSDDDERGFHAVVSAAILASTVLAVLAVALAPLIFRLYSSPPPTRSMETPFDRSERCSLGSSSSKCCSMASPG